MSDAPKRNEVELLSIDSALRVVNERIQDNRTFISEAIGWTVMDSLLDIRLLLTSIEPDNPE
jgi:hypothetical protein